MKTKKIISIVVAFIIATSSLILPINIGNSLLNVSASTTKTSAVKMPSDSIKFNSSSSSFDVLSYPENGGFYYYNNNDDDSIKFYNVKDNTVKNVVNFKNNDVIIDVFVANSKMYLIKKTGDTTYYLDVFNPSTEKIEINRNLSEFITNENSSSVKAIGVDSLGRYYLAIYDYSKDEKNYSIHLLSKDFKEISSLDVDDKVYEFCGFDSTNGNFYYEGYTNWVHWGYDYDTQSLKCGNVTNDKITVNSKYLDILYQQYFYYHKDNATMLNNGTFVWTTTLYSKVRFLDSSKFDINTTESVPLLGSVSRAGYEGDDDKYGSVGTRVVHNDFNDTTVMYCNNNTLVGFDSDFNQIASFKTDYPVFSLFNYGENIIAMEKDTDGNYYLNNINWSMPTKIKLSSNSLNLRLGDSADILATTDSDIDYSYTWSSSDNSVASVTKNGKVYGNKAGSAVITVETQNGIKAQCTVTVEGKASQKGNTVDLSGEVSSNVSDNNYRTWSSVMNSYLSENDDGTLNRVENTSNGVLVEKYSQDGKNLISKKLIDKELDIFGGYFLGKDNNYLVFGQSNSDEDDNRSIMRVVKYTKDWTRVDDCRIYGSNTTVPFDAGSLRMIELDGNLYVYTCHKMYADDEGINHQANMLFTVDESALEVVDSMYNVSNLSEGYVSHSFNQFIRTDGNYIYRVDHSESNDYYINGQLLSVNGMTLSKYSKLNASTKVSVTIPVKWNVRSGNYTGASIGGFEIGSGNCLVVYNQDISGSNGGRNVYLNITDTMFNKSNQIQLTNYSLEDKINCSTPQLVKINENLFLVLWEETNTKTNKVTTKVMTIDSNGNTISSATTLPTRLSDCQPILCSDNMVRWYITNNSSPSLCVINPYDITNFHEHNFTSKITKEATCTETGILTYTCTECGETKTDIIPKIEHKWDNGVVTKDPTCTAEGERTYTCDSCGETKTSIIKKVNHKWDNGVVTKKPTCTAEGERTYTCETCGETKTTTIKKASHKWNNGVVTKEPTCITEGERTYTCKTCGETKTSTIKKVSHKWDNGVVTKEPTCTTEGERTYTCENCGGTSTSSIDMVDHKWNDGVVTKEPTCTEEGEKTYTCKVCGETYVDIINETGHDYTYKVIKEATCTKDGVGKYICKNCGDTETYTIKATGHDYYYNLIFANMYLDGRYTEKCSICGNVLHDDVINKITSVKLSKSTLTYNGKKQTPNVIVKDSKKKTLQKNSDYRVTYGNGCKNVGRYAVNVDFVGNYRGDVTLYYNVLPKSTSIKSINGLSKGMQIKLNLQKTQTTGYQIQFSTSKNFTNSKIVTVKNNVSLKKITKLKSKKKYYVRVRTYKTTKFSGKNYNLYSSWSSAKSVTTK